MWRDDPAITQVVIRSQLAKAFCAGGDLDELAAEEHAQPDRPIHEETLQLVLMALGDALLGAPMARALGLPRDAARDLALQMLAKRPGVAK